MRIYPHQGTARRPLTIWLLHEEGPHTPLFMAPAVVPVVAKALKPRARFSDASSRVTSRNGITRNGPSQSRLIPSLDPSAMLLYLRFKIFQPGCSHSRRHSTDVVSVLRQRLLHASNINATISLVINDAKRVASVYFSSH
jgi:hypothetical protein